MYRTLAIVAALALPALTGCRQEEPLLDDVQRMAYAVKPAVVRVTSQTVADIEYDADVIRAAAREISRAGIAVEGGSLPSGPLRLATSAGSAGSGFGVHPGGLILTSAHVVSPQPDPEDTRTDLIRSGAIAIIGRHFGSDVPDRLQAADALEQTVRAIGSRSRLSEIEYRREVILSNGQRHPFRLLGVTASLDRGGSDLALLWIRMDDLPSLQVRLEPVHIQQPLWVAGYPAGASSVDAVMGSLLSTDSDFEASFNAGSITAIKQSARQTPLLQTDAAIYRGNSGGPAVDRSGRVIGVVTMGHTEADGIRFLVPASEIAALLDQFGVEPNERGRFDAVWSAALAAAAGGAWDSAQPLLRNAAKLFPGSPDVMRLQAEAARSAGDRTPRSLSTFGRAALALGLLFSGGLAALLLLQRRGGETSPPMPAVLHDERMVHPRRGMSSDHSMGRLTILNGEQAGDRYDLGGSGIRLGREYALCEIVLADPKISRLHAEFVEIDGKILLIDRNSSNGTYVNDHRIERTFLRDGDIIYFGGRNAVAAAFQGGESRG